MELSYKSRHIFNKFKRQKSCVPREQLAPKKAKKEASYMSKVQTTTREVLLRLELVHRLEEKVHKENIAEFTEIEKVLAGGNKQVAAWITKKGITLKIAAEKARVNRVISRTACVNKLLHSRIPLEHVWTNFEWKYSSSYRMPIKHTWENMYEWKY